MCQQERAPQIFCSVARCLTCRDTVCVAHLQAHNAAHKGHGHKVFFLSNQNLAQFAQNAAEVDSSLRAPTCPPVRDAVFSPESNVDGAAAARSAASAANSSGIAADPFNNPLSPSLQWREPVGHFGSSAAVVAADMPWADAYLGRAPWDLGWDSASPGSADLGSNQPSPSMFVGERSVHSSGSMYGSLW